MISIDPDGISGINFFSLVAKPVKSELKIPERHNHSLLKASVQSLGFVNTHQQPDSGFSPVLNFLNLAVQRSDELRDDSGCFLIPTALRCRKSQSVQSVQYMQEKITGKNYFTKSCFLITTRRFSIP